MREKKGCWIFCCFSLSPLRRRWDPMQKAAWRDLRACRRQIRVCGFECNPSLCPQMLLSFPSSSSPPCPSFFSFSFFSVRDHYFQPRRYFTGIKTSGFFLFFSLSALHSGFTAGVGQQIYSITTETLIHDTDGKSAGCHFIARRINATASEGFSCLHHLHFC